MVQAATILYLLAKNAGVAHQSFYVCALMGSFLAKIYGLTNMAKKPHFGSISHFFPKFGPKLFSNDTSCHIFVFASQKYWCSTSKF